jgi:hypothetical protein
MCTFAETEIVDYHLLFADQGKPKSGSVFAGSTQTEVAISVFRLQQTNGGCPFPFVPFPFVEFWKRGDMDMETWRHGDLETWRLRDTET